MKDELIVERGRAAGHLLENEIFREVMNGLDAQYHAAWRDAKTIEAREDCHRYVCLVEKFIADITAISTNGKFAANRIRELTATKERIFAWPR